MMLEREEWFLKYSSSDGSVVYLVESVMVMFALCGVARSAVVMCMWCSEQLLLNSTSTTLFCI